jgi:hypothetical protein
MTYNAFVFGKRSLKSEIMNDVDDLLVFLQNAERTSNYIIFSIFGI